MPIDRSFLGLWLRLKSLRRKYLLERDGDPNVQLKIKTDPKIVRAFLDTGIKTLPMLIPFSRLGSGLSKCQSLFWDFLNANLLRLRWRKRNWGGSLWLKLSGGSHAHFHLKVNEHIDYARTRNIFKTTGYHFNMPGHAWHTMKFPIIEMAVLFLFVDPGKVLLIHLCS